MTVVSSPGRSTCTLVSGASGAHGRRTGRRARATARTRPGAAAADRASPSGSGSRPSGLRRPGPGPRTSGRGARARGADPRSRRGAAPDRRRRARVEPSERPGVAGEVDPRAGIDDIPDRLRARGTRRDPVRGRDGLDGDTADREPVPGPDLDHLAAESPGARDRPGRAAPRPSAIRGATERRRVEVVLMPVRDQHEVDVRSATRWAPVRAAPGDPGAPQERVGQDAQSPRRRGAPWRARRSRSRRPRHAPVRHARVSPSGAARRAGRPSRRARAAAATDGGAG